MARGKHLLFIASAAAAVLSAIVLLPAVDHLWDDGSLPFQWAGRSYADLVVMNATIYTSDSSLPFAEAMAIRGGRIIRVGDYSSMKDLVLQETKELNLYGKVVLPGFIDSHVHFIFGGLRMRQVQLRGVSNKGFFIKLLKDALKDKGPGEWILGGGWNNDLWGGELPEASWIDSITPSNPVWLSRMDGHMGLANSVALEVAGINTSSHDPVGGTIVRTVDGEPTGLLADSAMKLVLDVIPEISIHERRNALISASKYALSKGVTTVVDFGRNFPGESLDHVWQDFTDVYQWAVSSREMLVRVCIFFPLQTLGKLIELSLHRNRELSQWIHIGGVKAFADGSLGSNTALFHEPYEDDPKNHGLHIAEPEWLQNATAESYKFGIQVAIHAIGDKANDMVLDMYDTIVSAYGVGDHRLRIEHAQHLGPGSAKRFGQQNVIASVQDLDHVAHMQSLLVQAYNYPDHLLDDAGSAEKKLGQTRAREGSYLFQSLLSGGAQIAFGSDWPVVDIDPLRAINTALHRVPPEWDSAWIPSERLCLDDAVKASTTWAAYACFLDKDLGSLSVGKYADFVVLPVDSWDQFAKDVPNSVFATYVNGKQAYP